MPERWLGKRVGSVSPSCTRYRRMFMHISAISPTSGEHEWVREHLTVNEAGRRARQIALMFQTSVRIPWEGGFRGDPMRTSGMKMLTPDPKPSLISNDASSFFFPHIFILSYTKSMICVPFASFFLLGAGKDMWRINTERYTRVLSLGTHSGSLSCRQQDSLSLI